MHTHYAPPALDQEWIFATLKDEFPSHKSSAECVALLKELVTTYTHWWQLMLTYPERRIVGTPPLWYVRQVHARRMERFFFDCFTYLGKIVSKDDIWQGELDLKGTFDTARSIRERYNYFLVGWEPILILDEKLRDEKVIRLQ